MKCTIIQTNLTLTSFSHSLTLSLSLIWCFLFKSVSSINPLWIFPALGRNGYPSNEALDVHHAHVVISVKHLPHMLISESALDGKRLGVWKSVAAIRIMTQLVMLDLRPNAMLQEVKIRHVLISAAPREHLFGHVLHSAMNASPHAAVHHDAMIHVIAEDMDGLLRRDPLLYCYPASQQNITKDTGKDQDQDQEKKRK